MKKNLRFSSGMIIRGYSISIYTQACILSLFAQNIHRDEIANIIYNSLNCTYLDATRIVESVLGTCTRGIYVNKSETTPYNL